MEDRASPMGVLARCGTEVRVHHSIQQMSIMVDASGIYRQRYVNSLCTPAVDAGWRHIRPTAALRIHMAVHSMIICNCLVHFNDIENENLYFTKIDCL